MTFDEGMAKIGLIIENIIDNHVDEILRLGIERDRLRTSNALLLAAAKEVIAFEYGECDASPMWGRLKAAIAKAEES